MLVSALARGEMTSVTSGGGPTFFFLSCIMCVVRIAGRMGCLGVELGVCSTQ